MTEDELMIGLLALARALGRYQAGVDIRRQRDPGPDGTEPDDLEPRTQVKLLGGILDLDSRDDHGRRE